MFFQPGLLHQVAHDGHGRLELTPDSSSKGLTTPIAIFALSYPITNNPSFQDINLQELHKSILESIFCVWFVTVVLKVHFEFHFRDCDVTATAK
jgi:hypothetical protein